MLEAFVTGAKGFVGRHMVAELVERGYRCTIVDLPTDMVDYISGRHLADGRQLLTRQFDLVVHCAYVVGGRSGINSNRSALADNLRLDSELFRWAVATGQPHVLYFSSSAAYPCYLQTGQEDPDYSIGRGYRLDEDDINTWNPDPDADYGWAKLTGERLAANARAQGVRVSVVRPFSGYSETQSLDYPFPSIVKRVLSGDLSVWGPPGQTRDWIHIDDVINGALKVVEYDALGMNTPELWAGPVNLCTGVGTEMGDLAVMIAERAGLYNSHWSRVSYDDSKPTGVMSRIGDPARMWNYYHPQIPLRDGVDRAVAGLLRGQSIH